MSIRSVRDYAAVTLKSTKIRFKIAPGPVEVERPWNPAVLSSDAAGVAAMLAIPAGSSLYGDDVNEGLAGTGAGSPLSAIANHPSNPLGLDADLVGKYVVTQDDAWVCSYVEGPDGTALWNTVAKLPGGPPGGSGAGFDKAQADAQAAAEKHQEELYAWDQAHPDQAPQSERGKAEAAQVLKLLGGRFEVRIPAWEEPAGRQGRKGAGQAVQMFPGIGWFWFFDAQTPEVMVTLIDNGGAGHSVKWNASTDVGFDLTVTDKVTGKVRSYHNPVGNLVGTVDWLAFPA